MSFSFLDRNKRDELLEKAKKGAGVVAGVVAPGAYSAYNVAKAGANYLQDRYSGQQQQAQQQQPQTQQQQTQQQQPGTQPAPQVQPKPQPQQQTQPQMTSAQLTQQYLDRMGQRASDRIGGIEQRAQDRANTQESLYNRRNQTLENIGNIQSNAFDQYASNIRKGVDLQGKTANRQIQSTQDLYQDQRLQNEKSRQERMKGLENTLAGLGTLNSSALMNVGARINMGAERQDRTAQRDMNNRVANIEDQYSLIENEAEGLIQQEASRYQQRVEALAEQMDTNSLEFQQAVGAIADQANQNINGILDNLDDFAYNAQLEIIKAQNEQGNQLSDAFLTTGQPQNRADYQWLMENPDYQQQQTGQSQRQQQAQNTLNIVDELIQEDLGAETGFIQSRLPAFSQTTQDTISKIDQVKATLELASAGQLKGQGQVSEGEREILRRAASGLDRARSEDEFRIALQNARKVLEQIAGPQASQANNQNTQMMNQQLVNQFGG